MRIDPLLLPALLISLLLTGLFLAAAFYDIRSFHRRRKRQQTVYRCAACHSIYERPHRTPLARCPHCRHQNEPLRF